MEKSIAEWLMCPSDKQKVDGQLPTNSLDPLHNYLYIHCVILENAIGTDSILAQLVNFLMTLVYM